MNSEYKILQDKIDKIGAFRFTIRGWSVTLVIASIVATGSSKVVSPYVLCLLVPFIYALYAVERKQNELSRSFGERALHLERRLKEELRFYAQADPVVGFYPGIAYHLHDAQREHPVGTVRAWLADPDHFFYLIQFIAVGLAIAVLSFLSPSRESDPAKGQTIIQMQSDSSTASRDETGELTTPISKGTTKQEQKSVNQNRH
ncbi:MAG: hypothetical protein LAO22_22195 [Acidobacteriia bacterium]|nr:hypothetical protein [Terriglobia bacterium]